MSLVETNLFLGGKRVSTDSVFVQKNRIALIVNVSDDLPCFFEESLRYIRIPLKDEPTENLLECLCNDQCAMLTEISSALGNGDAVLVHCRAGSSRSASVVLAHLIKNRGMSLWNAYQALSEVQPVKPNPGFKKQLCAFEERVLGTKTSVEFDSFGNWKEA